MKRSQVILLMLLGTALSGWSEEVAVRSDAGGFEVRQSPLGENEERGVFAWSEQIVFVSAEKKAVALESFSWPAIYEVSRDGEWLLRIQETGSGSNIALLYRIEENGRVSAVKDFDARLWAASDRVAAVEKADLFHTAVVFSGWSEDGDRLLLELRGTNTDSRPGAIRSIQVELVYELDSNRVKPVVEAAADESLDPKSDRAEGDRN